MESVQFPETCNTNYNISNKWSKATINIGGFVQNGEQSKNNNLYNVCSLKKHPHISPKQAAS